MKVSNKKIVGITISAVTIVLLSLFGYMYFSDAPITPTVDPVTKRKVSSGVTYGQLMTKNCSDVSWYVRKNGEGWKVECNGYKVTIEVDDLVTPDNSKTWTDAHLRINYFVSKDKDGNYVLDSYKIKINDDDELDDTYAALVIDDLLSKAK